MAHHQARERVLVRPARREPCDLFFAAFTGTDRLHHFLWEQMERGVEPWASRFHAYYDLVDGRRRAGRSVAGRLPWCLSDHGFCRLDQEVYVNRWLERDGWLPLQGAGRSRSPRSCRPALARTAWIPAGSTSTWRERARRHRVLLEYHAVRDDQLWGEGAAVREGGPALGRPSPARSSIALPTWCWCRMTDPT